MKPEDAIKTIELALTEVEWEYPIDYSVAFNEAINALKLQIPKKVNGGGIGYLNNRCQSCGAESVALELSYGGTSYADYCPRCGQALDWSRDV